MNAIEYFVAYQCPLGWGRAPVKVSEPIRSMVDVVAIEDYLKAQCVQAGMKPEVAEALVVVSWQRFDQTASGLNGGKLIGGRGQNLC